MIANYQFYSKAVLPRVSVKFHLSVRLSISPSIRFIVHGITSIANFE